MPLPSGALALPSVTVICQAFAVLRQAIPLLSYAVLYHCPAVRCLGSAQLDSDPPSLCLTMIRPAFAVLRVTLPLSFVALLRHSTAAPVFASPCSALALLITAVHRLCYANHCYALPLPCHSTRRIALQCRRNTMPSLALADLLPCKSALA